MKIKIVKLLLFFGLIINVGILNAQNYKKFTASIEQDNLEKEIVNNEVFLTKSSFTIKITMPEPMEILIHASFNDETYSLANSRNELSLLPGFVNTGMAEELKNENKEIFISKDSPNYWFFDSEEEHRFNEIIKSEDLIICKRQIENFFEVDSKRNTKVEEVDKVVYLVFVTYKWTKDFTERIELQREYIKLRWLE